MEPVLTDWLLLWQQSNVLDRTKQECYSFIHTVGVADLKSGMQKPAFHVTLFPLL